MGFSWNSVVKLFHTFAEASGRYPHVALGSGVAPHSPVLLLPALETAAKNDGNVAPVPQTVTLKNGDVVPAPKPGINVYDPSQEEHYNMYLYAEGSPAPVATPKIVVPKLSVEEAARWCL
jgi:hypothetical protein